MLFLPRYGSAGFDASGARTGHPHNSNRLAEMFPRVNQIVRGF